jgi:hypothetical protein
MKEKKTTEHEDTAQQNAFQVNGKEKEYSNAYHSRDP